MCDFKIQLKFQLADFQASKSSTTVLNCSPNSQSWSISQTERTLGLPLITPSTLVCNYFCVFFLSSCKVCRLSVNKHFLYEFHWLFELQSRSRNEGHESLSDGKRIERKMTKIRELELKLNDVIFVQRQKHFLFDLFCFLDVGEGAGHLAQHRRLGHQRVHRRLPAAPLI